MRPSSCTSDCVLLSLATVPSAQWQLVCIVGVQVEADTPAMLEISKLYKDNVLFCVIDTGVL
jgi:hypothetical protein